MRRAKTDRNHAEIMKTFRQCGCSVQSLHRIGQGCPDLLIGYAKMNFLIEVKDGDKAKSAQKLTDDEVDWHSKWKGQVAIISNRVEAIKFFDEEIQGQPF